MRDWVVKVGFIFLIASMVLRWSLGLSHDNPVVTLTGGLGTIMLLLVLADILIMWIRSLTNGQTRSDV